MVHEKNATVFYNERSAYTPRPRGKVLTRVGQKYEVVWEETGSATLVEGRELLPQAPDDRPFVWGDIIQTHRVGPYAIVQYIPNRPGNAEDDWEPGVSFHYYVDGKDTNHSTGSLDAALVACVAFRQEALHRGINAALNTRAPGYFMRMIGPDCPSDAEE